VCAFGGFSTTHSISFLLLKIIARFETIISHNKKIRTPKETNLIKEPKEETTFQDK
jgi:hypothetical protein